MIQISPFEEKSIICSCGRTAIFSKIIWQGVHTCGLYICESCGVEIIKSVPVNQSNLEEYILIPSNELVTDTSYNQVKLNWYSKIMLSIAKPVNRTVEMDVEIFRKSENVMLLNTLDHIYGHSLSFLFNLQKLAPINPRPGIIVIVQPMLRWLIPVNDVDEIWTVKLGFKDFLSYYSDLTEKINAQLPRFSTVYLSKGHILPTNQNIRIERFTGFKPFDFKSRPAVPRITFIWREDPDRLWIRNIYLLKIFKKLGLSKALLPIQYTRVRLLFKILRGNLGSGYKISLAGLGRSFSFPGSIDDMRIEAFNEENEKLLCRIYSESEIVIGVHGSSMLLPSAHAGMAISMMPSKRWGNYGEDILFVEEDNRLALFQRRIIPLNLSVFEISDIAYEMLTGREYFIKKVVHTEEL
jgi:hypothetical protein